MKRVRWDERLKRRYYFQRKFQADPFQFIFPLLPVFLQFWLVICSLYAAQFCNSQTLWSTEAETEYSVNVLKRMYITSMLCSNTMISQREIYRKSFDIKSAPKEVK
ncbi:hypothetical protein QVD17_36994 [Tagetes erecta]|uniref:Uncharacterized protein n=1 Tax=Tagetes erecta TaxID=13708 RepID=A0AAD8JXE8_TARER|nr:hypothetical protein QVD17_36994 [Tagetes erecta]